jgi:hypothetical protein
VLLLWEGEDLTNFSLGEGIGRVGRWHKGCTRRRVDRVSVEFSKEKT